MRSGFHEDVVGRRLWSGRLEHLIRLIHIKGSASRVSSREAASQTRLSGSMFPFGLRGGRSSIWSLGRTGVGRRGSSEALPGGCSLIGIGSGTGWSRSCWRRLLEV